MRLHWSANDENVVSTRRQIFGQDSHLVDAAANAGEDTVDMESKTGQAIGIEENAARDTLTAGGTGGAGTGRVVRSSGGAAAALRSSAAVAALGGGLLLLS